MKRETGTSTGARIVPVAWGGDRRIPRLFSIAGVIVGVFSVAKFFPDSVAMILLGVSLIGVAICFQRGRGMRH